MDQGQNGKMLEWSFYPAAFQVTAGADAFTLHGSRQVVTNQP